MQQQGHKNKDHEDGQQPLTGSREAEGPGDGVQTVQTESDKGVSGSVGDHALSVADGLAAHVPSVPVDGTLPDDVRQHVHQARRQICGQDTLVDFINTN